MKANDTFNIALEKFAEGGARRILLFKPKEIQYGAVASADIKTEDEVNDTRKRKISTVVGIISQADVVKFIHEHVMLVPCSNLSLIGLMQKNN